MPIKGFDIFKGDGTCDFAQAFAAGYSFAYVKATQRLTPDARWSDNILGAQSVGLLAGSYEFFEPTGDAANQARAFLAKVGGAAGLKGQLLPVVDVERRGGMTVLQYTQSVAAYCDVLEHAIGRKPILYMSRDYALHGVISEWFAGYPLWLAQWQTEAPAGAVGAWAHWTFWQDSANATVPGLPNVGGADTDRFAGTLAELQKLVV